MSIPIKLYITSKDNDFTKYTHFANNIRLRRDNYNKNNYQYYVLNNLSSINTQNLQNSIIIDDPNVYYSLNDKQKEYIKGIHYSSKNLSLLTEDSIWKKDRSFQTISASCHNAKEISIANELNLDFIIISPVLKDKGLNIMLGWNGFKKLASHANMKVLALGGIDDSQKNYHTCLDNGGYGIAGIQFFWKKYSSNIIKNKLSE